MFSKRKKNLSIANKEVSDIMNVSSEENVNKYSIFS